MSPRARWLFIAAAIIVIGVASRLTHTGWIVSDKYLGDALYAAMFCALFNAMWPLETRRNAIAALVLMLGLEFFQLTLIPAHMAQSGHFVTRMTARLLGTQFSWLDIAAYVVGVGLVGIWLARYVTAKSPGSVL